MSSDETSPLVFNNYRTTSNNMSNSAEISTRMVAVIIFIVVASLQTTFIVEPVSLVLVKEGFDCRPVILNFLDVGDGSSISRSHLFDFSSKLLAKSKSNWPGMRSLFSFKTFAHSDSFPVIHRVTLDLL